MLARFANLERRSKTQLKTWRHTTERHEQVALGQKTSGSKAKTEQWLEEVEKKIEGIGGETGSVERESKLGDEGVGDPGAARRSETEIRELRGHGEVEERCQDEILIDGEVENDGYLEACKV